MTAPRIRTAVAIGALITGLGGLQTATAADPNTFSANVGAVSNYIWRGVSQTQDGAAVQGGLDYAHESGFYAGLWASNVDFNNEGAPQTVEIPVIDGVIQPNADGNYIYETSGSSNPRSPNYELDVYTGFGGKFLKDWKWDLNAILYAYPDGTGYNFAEIGGKLNYQWITVGLAYTVWGQPEGVDGDNKGVIPYEGDLYSYGALDFALPYDFAFNAHGGYYMYRNSDGQSYANWGVSVSRTLGEFGTASINYDQNGGNERWYDNDPKVWVGWKKTF